MYNIIIGCDYKEVLIPLKSDERIRVIKPNQVITQDYNEHRINIVVGDDDLIQRIYRG